MTDTKKNTQTTDLSSKQPLFIDGVMSCALTEDEINIAKIQSAMKKLGYQWQEHQFNDGFDEVYIEITKNKDPSTIGRNKEDAGWGRIGRLTAWTKALDWALDWALQRCS